MLICDFAETYHIYDFRQLPLSLVAVFCVGLRENSRVKLKQSQLTVDVQTFLLSYIVDQFSLLLWSKTEKGQKGRDRPESIIKRLTFGKDKTNQTDIFNTGEEFLKTRKKLIEQM